MNSGVEKQQSTQDQQTDGGGCPFQHPPADLPVADLETGLKALKHLVRDRSLLGSLVCMHEDVGNVFQITLPRFRPAVAVGPEANRQLLIDDKDKFNWRTESDPVTQLLRQGVLVTDGALHDRIRSQMDPALYRKQAVQQLQQMEQDTAYVADAWTDGAEVDMLVEMRRVALLILIGALFDVDFREDMERMWPTILHILEFISPGFWIVWPGMPRPQYRHSVQEMDEFLFGMIRKRRRELAADDNPASRSDLLSKLVLNDDFDDDLIRDQLLTMLIAGHDTSTATLAWALYLLGAHPKAMEQARAEVDRVFAGETAVASYNALKQLDYLDCVIKETLRLYPPIHLGNRQANTDINLQGYLVPKGTRVMYSIYLAHRDPKYWSDPNDFIPERFDRRHKQEQPPLTYIPFGGGPRNCIGAAFAQVETKLVLAYLLKHYQMTLLSEDITTYMGATLEPRPGVIMQVRRRGR